VRTASGAVAVQLVVKDHGEVVDIEHVGSAHTDADLALLLAAARERLQPGQQALDLGQLAAEPARVTPRTGHAPNPGPCRRQKPSRERRRGGRGRIGRVVVWWAPRR
jgi:hypothetical protein